MKKIYIKLIMLLVFAFSFNACDTDDLRDLNVNPNAVNEIDMSYLLAQAQLQNYPNVFAVSSLESTVSAYIQHMAAVQGYWNLGDKYLEATLPQADFYKYSYLGPIVTINEVIDNTKNNPDLAGLYAVARITKVMIMHRVTDLYGDIPYFEGGNITDSDFLPEYDPQEEIYADMLKELEESVDILNSGATFANPEQDLIYEGNLDKWEKFANSLMLRLAMRLSEVSPTEAEAWVNKAVAGNLLASNDDNAVLHHTDGPTLENMNPRHYQYEREDHQKLSTTFVDWLQANNDPRMMVYSGGIGDLGGTIDMDPANQKGLPNGYDVTTIKDYEGVTEDVDITNTYSRNNLLLVNRVAPSILLVYGEVQLLLAEAAERNWISGDPETYYNNGVVAAMTMYDVFDGLPVYVTEQEANDYLTANPYNPAQGLEMIGVQYWALNFTNIPEAYANWRRTGYPALTPVEYPTSRTDGVIPTRLKYLPSEAVTNQGNLLEAIQRQGPDTYTTNVWWDVD